MTIVGVAGEGARPNHQAALVGHGDVGLDSELMGFAGFALADAFDFRCMQGVELVLVLRLLPADAFGPFEQCVQVGDGTERCTDRGRQFAFDFAQHDAEDGALAPDGAPQGLELFGVGVAAGLAAQFLPSFTKVCFKAMPTRLAACTTLARAISSKRPSTGWAMAFSWTVVSTMTRSNSAGRTAWVCTAVSMVAFSSSSTPASPMAVRKRPIWVASQGSLGL